MLGLLNCIENHYVETPSMTRKLVVCIDGTWNHPDQFDDIDRNLNSKKEASPSNVCRVWAAITRTLPSAEPVQCKEVGNITAIYIRGIGTSKKDYINRFAGLTGLGTTNLVLRAYKELAKHYEPKSEIYLFGFSRGAFAARSLAGMLYRCGLPHNPSSRTINMTTKVSHYIIKRLTNTCASRNAVNISFIGLWDSVASIALPKIVVRMHDISPPVKAKIWHALALDESRRHFRAVFWDKSPSNIEAREVWFAGAHANIGGGYNDTNLSNIAMFWILRGAVDAGLPITLRDVKGYDYEQWGEAIRNSYHEFFKRAAKLIATLKAEAILREIRSIPDHHLIHQSVFDAKNDSSYSPLAKLISKKRLEDFAIEEWGFDEQEVNANLPPKDRAETIQAT